MNKYRCVLLDWDGNLAKTMDVWLKAFRLVLEKRGLHLSDTEIASCFALPMERFQELGIKDIEQAMSDLDEAVAKLLPEAELYPDALEVLEKLKMRGIRTALITASHRKYVIQLLDKYNMHQFFDVVITNEDTKHHKPNPEPLEKAMNELGSSKSEAIMIGDSGSDIGAANNAGIDSILFFPPEHKKFYSLSELQSLNPTHTIKDFRTVLNIV